MPPRSPRERGFLAPTNARVTAGRGDPFARWASPRAGTQVREQRERRLHVEEGPAMTLGGRAAIPVIVALVLSAFVVVAPASAAIAGVQWQAKVGSGGINGTSAIRVDTSGAGIISVSLKLSLIHISSPRGRTR